MLSDNIKNLRKKNYMSQDELAEKVGVSRQSVSLWENGQTQPTIDNIITLAKIFNISSDMLLGDSDNVNISQDNSPEEKSPGKSRKRIILFFASFIAAAVILGIVIFLIFFNGRPSESLVSNNDNVNNSAIQSENSSAVGTSSSTSPKSSHSDTSKPSDLEKAGTGSNDSSVNQETASPIGTEFDLFFYCKDFAIQKGSLNGDYCIYQQPATKYGGYDNEYFSIAYWADSNMVEFCLHCPLDETYSHNFYLRMRGGYNKKYEYLSSKYYRETGESLRSATGYIDPAVFSDSYPISCDEYIGSSNGQDQFMEDSRVGICDLITCLKEFVEVEGMECDFYDFDFVNF